MTDAVMSSNDEILNLHGEKYEPPRILLLELSQGSIAVGIKERLKEITG